MSAPLPSPVRYDALDGLRGVAALGVVAYHYESLFGAGPAHFRWGFLCVDLFFIMSGFVLAHRYERAIGEGTLTFRAFFAARMARLWPMHAVATLAVVALVLFETLALSNRGMFDLDAPGATLLLNLTLLQNAGFLDRLTWNFVAWSISAEVLVNFAWFAATRRRRAPVAWLVAACITSALLILAATGPATLDLTHQRLFGFLNGGLVRCVMGFALGLALYRVAPMGGASWPRAVHNALTLLATGGLALLVSTYGTIALPGLDWACAVLLFPLLVVLAATQGSPLNRLFRQAPLVWLGTISYAVYLCQYPVAHLVGRASDALRRLQIGFDAPAKGIVYFAALLAVAALAHRHIEVPAAAWLRRRFAGVRARRMAGTAGARNGLAVAGRTTRAVER
jgi:peptidoglycan/LPS O-acetylase OafA/YrhL